MSLSISARRLNRIAAFTPIVLLIAASGSLSAAEHCPIARKAVHSEEAAVEMAEKVVEAYRLTSLPIRCIRFSLSPMSSPAGYEVTLYEHHVGKDKCGRDYAVDPNIAHRLMTLKIRENGYVTTDANRTDGKSKPLVCPKNTKRIKQTEQ